MKVFFKTKRDGNGLWLKIYTDCKWPWYAATLPLNKDKNMREQVRQSVTAFINELKKEQEK